MRIIFLFLLVVLGSGCQPLALYGDVIDHDGKPIHDALIVNKRSGQPVAETRSDSIGRFFLNQMRLNDTVVVMAPGFQTETAVYDYPLAKRPRITFWLKQEKESSIP